MNDSIKKYGYLKPQLKNEAMLALMQAYSMSKDCSEEEWEQLTKSPPFEKERAERIFMLLCPLSVKAFNEYCFTENIDTDELASICYCALYNGIIKFNPKMNNGEKADVKTYANKHMLNEIKNFLSRSNSTCLSVTSYASFKLKKIKKIVEDLSIELGRNPTIEEISQKTGYSVKNIMDIIDRKLYPSIRLDAEYEDQETDTCNFYEAIEDKNCVKPFQSEDHGTLSNDKKIAILQYFVKVAEKAQIPENCIPKAVDIFCLSTGCFGQKSKFEEIALKYGISSRTCKSYVKKIKNNISEEEIRKIFLNCL